MSALIWRQLADRARDAAESAPSRHDMRVMLQASVQAAARCRVPTRDGGLNTDPGNPCQRLYDAAKAYVKPGLATEEKREMQPALEGVAALAAAFLNDIEGR